jgi:hypothetical protein
LTCDERPLKFLELGGIQDGQFDVPKDVVGDDLYVETFLETNRYVLVLPEVDKRIELTVCFLDTSVDFVIVVR